MIFKLEQYKNRIALIEGDYKYTYGELNEASDKIVENIRQRTLVFSMCTVSFGSVAGYIGFLNHNIVPLLLNAKIDRDLIGVLLKTYLPEYIWLPEADADKYYDEFEEIYNGYGYSLLKAKIQHILRLNNKLGLLISTSGSTGSPKLVRQSYANITSNTESIIKYLDITPDERAVASLAMNYVYGLSVINTHLYVGASLVLTELKCYSKKFWEICKMYEVTSFSGIPFMYEMMHKLNIFNMAFPSLKTLTQAGGKLTPELQQLIAEYAEKNRKRFIVMYGASEATARMGYLPAEYALSKRGSMGIAIPGGKFELIDMHGNIITEPDVVGELIYYGNNVTLGYAEKAEDLAEDDSNHGMLQTGDMAKRDEDGFYYIVGRKKRFVKIHGNRVNLDEVERIIKSYLSETDIACTGNDDNLKIYSTNPNLKERIRGILLEKVGLNPNLVKVIIIDEIPKNDSGKILYGILDKLGEHTNDC